MEVHQDVQDTTTSEEPDIKPDVSQLFVNGDIKQRIKDKILVNGHQSNSNLLESITKQRLGVSSLSPSATLQVKDMSHRTSISSLLREFVVKQEELDAKMRKLENEIKIISHLNVRQAYCQLGMKSTSYSQPHHMPSSIYKREVNEEKHTSIDLSCSVLLQKLSTLTRNRNRMTYEATDTIRHPTNPIKAHDPDTIRHPTNPIKAHDKSQLFNGKLQEGFPSTLGNLSSLTGADNNVGPASSLNPSRRVSVDFKGENVLKTKSYARKPERAQKQNLLSSILIRLKGKYLNGKPRHKKMVKCSLCHSTIRYCSIQSHMRSHSKGRLYPCDVCNRTFPSYFSLFQHTRTHKGLNPFKCSICSKDCNSLGQLNRHKKSHSELRPYACSVCGKSFKMQAHLVTHSHIHSDERHFLCSECGLSFKHRPSLHSHMKKCHPGLKHKHRSKKHFKS